jgi:hypothetical protein
MIYTNHKGIPYRSESSPCQTQIPNLSGEAIYLTYSTGVALWMFSCGIVIKYAFTHTAGILAPETPEVASQSETRVCYEAAKPLTPTSLGVQGNFGWV